MIIVKLTYALDLIKYFRGLRKFDLVSPIGSQLELARYIK